MIYGISCWPFFNAVRLSNLQNASAYHKKLDERYHKIKNTSYKNNHKLVAHLCEIIINLIYLQTLGMNDWPLLC